MGGVVLPCSPELSLEGMKSFQLLVYTVAAVSECVYVDISRTHGREREREREKYLFVKLTKLGISSVHIPFLLPNSHKDLVDMKGIWATPLFDH